MFNYEQILKEKDEINSLIIKRRYEQESLLSSINNLNIQKTEALDRTDKISKGILLMQNFSETLKKDIIGKFEELVTKGLCEVFEKDYRFSIEFSTHGSSLTADFIISLPDGKRVNMATGEGGGVRDFTSLLQRILYLILDPARPDRVLFLDENLKHLDSERAKRAFVFIKKILSELDIQTIFITHSSAVKEIENEKDINIIEL